MSLYIKFFNTIRILTTKRKKNIKFKYSISGHFYLNVYYILYHLLIFFARVKLFRKGKNQNYATIFKNFQFKCFSSIILFRKN